MNKALKIFAVVLIVIAVMIGCAVVYFSYQNSVLESEKKVVKVQKIPEIVDEVNEVVEMVEEEIATSTEEAINPAECVQFQERVDDTAGKIEVDWIKGWATTSPEVIFGEGVLKKIDFCFYNDSDYSDLPLDIFFKEVYEKGTIINGPYKGSKIYYAFVRGDGPYYQTPFYRLIKNGDKIIYLSNYSDKLWKGLDKYFIINNSIDIPSLDVPELIKIPDSDFSLISNSGDFEKISEDSQMIFDQDNFSIIKNSGCFFVELADKTAVRYNFDVKFLDEGKVNLNREGFNKKDDYILTSYQVCGTYSNCYNYASDKIAINMKEIGKTSDGLIFYQSDEDFRDIYDVYYPGYQKEKVPYEDFIKDYPVIYWQDPFGDFLRFQKMKYQSGAECGKPVIYLYPKQEQDISVWVEPNGGLMVTEPVYDNGWRVRADTKSNIYNYADGETYPYLFWEGYAYNYKMGDEGFVVARDDVKDFLVGSLTKLGLVKKEYDEFIEFWLPKMQAKNYYFISFMPQAEFEKLAPLTVSPKPDTVIRVFMDYQGLDEAISVSPQKLSAPVRNGFTVVEWGGALHR